MTLKFQLLLPGTLVSNNNKFISAKLPVPSSVLVLDSVGYHNDKT